MTGSSTSRAAMMARASWFSFRSHPRRDGDVILRGERGVARARALVESFRPRRAARAWGTHVILTGFGSFPGAPRNATAEIVHAIASRANIEMRHPSFRARDFSVGRGALPIGADVATVSLMVLPVVWEAAAAL